MARNDEATREGGSGALLGGGLGLYTRIGSNPQGNSFLLREPLATFLGAPCVVVDRKPGSVCVRVASLDRNGPDAPWIPGERPRGWQNTDKEFLCAGMTSKSANRYAAHLLATIKSKREEDLACQAKAKAAARAEREARR